MIRDIHLHGRLGKKFGRVFALDVDSPAEAFRALSSQLPGFRQYVSARKYAVTTGSGVALGEEQLPMRLGSGRDIHVTPAGLLTGIETILLVGTLLFTAVSAIAMLSMVKMPKPGDREEATKTASFMFDGALNSAEQGHPVPLVYGRMRVGSVVGSAGITTSDVNEASVGADPTDPYGGPYDGFMGSSPGIRGSANGDEWTVLQKGGKGGSGASRSAQEDPNSLQSQATAKILDIVSEGEIVGLVDGMRSVYFDGTPLQNIDDTFNFAGVAVEQRVGLPDQDFVPGFAQTESTTAVDTEVSVLLGPVTRTINDQDVTVARVTIRLPQLYQQDTTNGDLKATSVEVKISVQADGGGFTDVITMTFDGKTNSGYQRSTDIRLPNGVVRDIRVTRLTADSAVASLSNETRWDLLTEVVEAKLSYPDTALIGLTVDARQFGSSIPTRSYDIKGLIIEVPSNYNPVTRVYTGVWDGTFQRAWSDNAAWVYRDIIVNRRYGLGERVPESAIDKWALYTIAQYNDELVPDGFGAMQPRYTINCCINNAAGAYEVIASIASNFRGWAYWGSGAVVVVQDSPEDPSISVTPANVNEGVISYGRVTPLERRRSASVVYWNDPEDGYRLAPEVYEVPDLVRRFGRRTGDEVTAFGVTNRGQAHRMARWIIEDESQGSNSTASYGVGDDHGFVEPGRIATVSDPMFTATRRGGRVKSATANQVILDAPVVIGAGAHTLRVTLPDGTSSVCAVTNGASTTDTINLGGAAYATAPLVGAVWTVESAAVANRQFRVRSISTDEPPYEVKAILHDPTKYDRVELERDISTASFMSLPTGPLEQAQDIVVLEFLLQKGNSAVPSVQVSWNSPTDPRITYFQAQYKRPGGAGWEHLSDSLDVSRVVEGTEAGTWSFRVRSLNSLGNKTAWKQADFILDGQVDDLPVVSTVAVAISADALTTVLIWDPPVDSRPFRYEVFFNTVNTFGSATSLGVVDTTEFVISQPGWYWVRTVFIQAFSAASSAVEVEAGDFPEATKTWPPSPTAPVGPSNGDLWPDTSTTPATLKRYNSTTALWSDVAANGAKVGASLYLTGGGVAGTVDVVTSAGTAAAIAGQGALATASSAAWGSQVTGRPAELTDGRITTALDSGGVLQTNITTARANASALLRYGGGGLFTGELTADLTSTHTAAAITGQGALATLGQVNMGASGRVYRDDGTTRLTDALAVTSLGTAAAIAGQGAWATYSTTAPAKLEGIETYASSDDNLVPNPRLETNANDWTGHANATRTTSTTAGDPPAFWRITGGAATLRPRSGAQTALYGAATLFFSIRGRTSDIAQPFQTQIDWYSAAGYLSSSYSVGHTLYFAAANTWEEKRWQVAPPANATHFIMTYVPTAAGATTMDLAAFRISRTGELGGDVTATNPKVISSDFSASSGPNLIVNARLTDGLNNWQNGAAALATRTAAAASTDPPFYIRLQTGYASQLKANSSDMVDVGTAKKLWYYARIRTNQNFATTPIAMNLQFWGSDRTTNTGFTGQALYASANNTWTDVFFSYDVPAGTQYVEPYWSAYAWAAGTNFDIGLPWLSASERNSTVGAIFGVNALETAGGSTATLSNFKTSLGTAAAIAGQAATATSSDFSVVTGATKPEANADVTLLVTGTKTVSVGFDYLGVVKSGELPLDVNFKLISAAGTDVTTSASWAGVLKSGTATFTPTVGSPNATGTLNVTVMSTDAVIEMQATYGGKVRSGTATLLQQPDPPPMGGGGGGGTSASTSTISNTTSSSYGAANTSILSVVAGAAGQVACGFNDSFRKVTNGTGDCHGKWQWRVVGGSFADITTEIASDASAFKAGAPEPANDAGSLNCSMTKTGLTNGTTYEFQLLLRSDGSYSLTHNGTASAVGS